MTETKKPDEETKPAEESKKTTTRSRKRTPKTKEVFPTDYYKLLGIKTGKNNDKIRTDTDGTILNG